MHADDSEEKILKDWNAVAANPFSNFDDLYRYLKGYTKEQGMQSKKDVYKYSRFESYVASERKKLETVTKRNLKQSVTMTLAFRQRIKKLKKNRRLLD